MSADYLAVALGFVAIVGQALNYILHLRVRSAILESERQLLATVGREFVRKETCVAEMRWLEAHPREEREQVDPDD